MLYWVFALLAIIFYFFYLPLTYWKRKNFPYIPPVPIFGNFLRSALGSESILESFKRIYDEYSNAKILGIYFFQVPAIVINDPELIRTLIVQNSDSFLNRSNLGFDLNYEPILSRNIASLKDERWRKVRSVLSPSFTTVKMNYMYDTIYKCGDQLKEYLDSLFDKKTIVELNMKETFAKYTNDTIISTSYGVEINSFIDPNNKFYTYGKRATAMESWRYMIRQFPINKILKVAPLPMDYVQFYFDVFRQNLRERRDKNIVRPDMLNLLMEAQKNSREKALTDKNEIELSDDDIIAQAFVFFFAGYDTTSSTIVFICYELALNPDCQQKLFEEIQKNSEESDKISYERLVNLKYMDMVVSESLRKWTPGALIDRICGKDFQINVEGKELKIKKGTSVFMPGLGIARDPKYFPNPDKYDPDRFNEENTKNLNQTISFPFGLGPRRCIGLRFGTMIVKIALFCILKNYEIVPSKNTEIPIKLHPNSVAIQPKTSWIGLKKRQH